MITRIGVRSTYPRKDISAASCRWRIASPLSVRTHQCFGVTGVSGLVLGEYRMDPVELAVFAEQALTIQVACRQIPNAH
jgi:hypothetical protein